MTLDGTERAVIEGRADGLQDLRPAAWSADGLVLYFAARTADGREGLYEVPADGGSARLLVRFDNPAMVLYGGRGVIAGNGHFYFAIGEMESDIYVADLVRR